MDITIIISGRTDPETSFHAPSLNKLIIQGNLSAVAKITLIKYLYSLFNRDLFEDNVASFASISGLADLKNAEEKLWIRVDPIFLHADLASLLLFDTQKFTLSKDDALAVIAVINDFLKGDDLKIVCGEDHSRWYLALDKQKRERDSMPSTSTPKEANGQDIQQFLPKGSDAPYWIQLSNEIQMLLHDSPINLQRQKRGEVPLNSIWFWGGDKIGDSDLEFSKLEFDQVVSNDVNAIGLSKYLNLKHSNLPSDFESWLHAQEKGQRILLVLSEGDLAASESEHYPSWLIEQDQEIFKPIISSLKKGKIKNVTIRSDDQYSRVKRSHFLRFWRKTNL